MDFDTPSFNLYQNFKTTLFDHNLLGLTIACFHDVQALLQLFYLSTTCVEVLYFIVCINCHILDACCRSDDDATTTSIISPSIAIRQDNLNFLDVLGCQNIITSTQDNWSIKNDVRNIDMNANDDIQLANDIDSTACTIVDVIVGVAIATKIEVTTIIDGSIATCAKCTASNSCRTTLAIPIDIITDARAASDECTTRDNGLTTIVITTRDCTAANSCGTRWICIATILSATDIATIDKCCAITMKT